MVERATSNELTSSPGTTFISGFVTRSVLSSLSSLGVSTKALCAAVGVDANALMDATARVPRGVVWSLFSEAEKLSGDPLIGLRVARSMPSRAAGGVLSPLVEVSETGEEAVRCLSRYAKLIADGMDVEVAQDDGSLTVRLIPAEKDATLTSRALEAFMAGICKVLAEAMTDPITPTRACFRHAPAAPLEVFEGAFGCVVEFRAPHYALEFPLDALQQEMVAAQPRAASRLRDLAESELRAIAPEFTVAVGEQVRVSIEDRERPTHASTAKRMGIGERTLQRRLREEGSSFRRIVDRERRIMACTMLKEPKRRVIEVALAVGFDDATSFSKAFRRWTGEAPSAFQARATN
ncbi:MAG: AraC family transcriptional regulator [Myxococcota bacterium]